jgi:hypothetical protein
MAYTVFQRDQRFGARPGLEGPFHYANGRVLYYDARAGEYWDPLTDFYVPRDEIDALNADLMAKLAHTNSTARRG